MRMEVLLGEKKKVDVKFDKFEVKSDQPKRGGGDETSPAPFDYFLASVALCAGFYIQAFCQTREIPYDDITITQDFIRDIHQDDTKFKFNINVKLPENFPEKYRNAVIQAAKSCAVKKVIDSGPDFEVNLID